ncbi:hypothetical protein MRX96_041207 [Rhipicephalus microplus]
MRKLKRLRRRAGCYSTARGREERERREFERGNGTTTKTDAWDDGEVVTASRPSPGPLRSENQLRTPYGKCRVPSLAETTGSTHTSCGGKCRLSGLLANVQGHICRA